MSSPVNWPHPDGDPDGYFRHQEKRLLNEQRRPIVRKGSDILGPGFAPYATQITDWGTTLSGGDEAAFNGYFWSAGNADNAPVNTGAMGVWMGWTVSTGTSGLQKVWDPATLVGYQRSWNVMTDTGYRTYGQWVSEYGPYCTFAASAPTSVNSATDTGIALATTVHCDTEYFTPTGSGAIIKQDGIYNVSGNALLSVVSVFANVWIGRSVSDWLAQHGGSPGGGAWYASPAADNWVIAAGAVVSLYCRHATGSLQTASSGRLTIRKVG